MFSNFCLQITFFVFFKKCFPLLFTFFTTESSENRPEGRKVRKGKYEKRRDPYIPLTRQNVMFDNNKN
jgi:hypothetical protein